MAKFELGSEIIPSVSIDRIILEPGSEEGKTSVFLDMSIQDTLDNKNTSWFFQEEFIDYVSIKVIQSHSNEDTRMILTQDISTILATLNNNSISDDNKDLNLSHEIKKFQNKVNDNGNLIKDLSFVDDPVETSDGNLIYRIPIRYNLETTIADHYSIFVYAHLDLGKIAQESGLNIPIDAFTEKVYGEISGETVINNDTVVSTSSVFYTTQSNGERIVWTGPVSYDSVTKEYYVPMSSPRKILELTSVPNYKVQDMRGTRVLVNPPVITQAMDQFKLAQKRLYNNTTLNFGINTENYCSPGAVSRGEEGVVSFIFDLDFNNLVKYKSLFGNLMSGPSQEDILEKSRITEMKIVRRRVKRRSTNSKLDTTISDIDVFDKNEPWETVVITGEKKDTRFIEQVGYYGNIPKNSRTKDNMIGSITEVLSANNNPEFPLSLRGFMFEDHTLKNKTYGLYQYGLEIQIQDGTVLFLQDMLIELSQAITSLSNYYTISTSLKFYNPETRKYNPSLARFYELNNESPWETAISTYIDSLEKLIYSVSEDDKEEGGSKIDILTGLEKTNLAVELNNLANPNSGTPEGTDALISLLKNLEDSIIKTLQGKTRFISQQNDSSKTKSYHNNNYNRFILNFSHHFSSCVDSDFPDGTGISVLPTESPTLYLPKLKTRAQQESAKYFKYKNPGTLQKNIGSIPGVNTENSGITNVTDSFYTFFSPSKISVNGQELELQNTGNKVWENSQYESFTSRLMQSVGSPKLTSAVGNNTSPSPSLGMLQDVLSKYSVTVSVTLEENKTTKETKKTGISSTSMSSKVPAKKTQSKTTDKLLINGISDISRTFTSLGLGNSSSSNKKTELKPTISNYDLTKNNNFIDNSVRKSPISKGQLESIPNQITSLFISDSPAVKNNWKNYKKQGIDFISNNQTDLMFLYNYSTLFKVEYCDGYEKSKDGKPLLNQQIWKELTQKQLERVENSEILLCRIQKYNNLEVGVKFPELLDLPIFDQHFFLAKNKTTLNKAKKPPQIKKKTMKPYQSALRRANSPADYEVSIFSRGIIRRDK